MTLDEAAKAYREAYNAGQVATARARHMAKVRAAQPRPDTTVCEVCGYEAMNRGGLASHRWAAHGLRMGAA